MHGAVGRPLSCFIKRSYLSQYRYKLSSRHSRGFLYTTNELLTICKQLTGKEYELLHSNKPATHAILFADFMEEWLEAMRHNAKMATFGGYQVNVQKIIAPWFRERGITLHGLTEDNINDFYTDQLKRINATSAHKLHANVSKALKYAVEKGN